ncbi:MAG: hypothetical protein ABIL09_16660 [Gemmatimonadota bacterium]
MATPQTIRLPWSADERGSFRLTSTRLQGVESTRQLLALSLQPRGATTHPWLQDVGFSEDVVFSDQVRARVDILAQIRSTFAGHAARERAQLVGTPTVERSEANPGALIVRVSWRDLRTGAEYDEELEVGA